MNRTKSAALVFLLAIGLSNIVEAQERRGGRAGGPPHPEVTVDWTELPQRIAWFGTLEPALAAAKKTGRPILLVSGAPACQAVPGVW